MQVFLILENYRAKYRFYAFLAVISITACSTSTRNLPENASHALQELPWKDGDETVSQQSPKIASWYGRRFHRRRTASGERFNMYAMTAAHRTLPLGSKISVRNLHSGRSVIVRVNDRGPYKDNRALDVSYAAGRALGILKSGLAPVEITLINP